MTEYRIDISRVNSRDDLHDILEETLPLPSWYGRNLDALYDVLTSLPESFEVRAEEDPTAPPPDPFFPEAEEAGPEIEDAPDEGGYRFVFVGTEAALSGEAGDYVERLRRMCGRVGRMEENILFRWE